MDQFITLNEEEALCTEILDDGRVLGCSEERHLKLLRGGWFGVSAFDTRTVICNKCPLTKFQEISLH